MKTRDGVAVNPGHIVYDILAGGIVEVKVKDWMADMMPHYYGTMQAAAADLVEQLNEEISRLEERRNLYVQIANVIPD